MVGHHRSPRDGEDAESLACHLPRGIESRFALSDTERNMAILAQVFLAEFNNDFRRSFDDRDGPLGLRPVLIDSQQVLFDSELKGVSPIRGERRWRSLGSMPALQAATTMAASVGSP